MLHLRKVGLISAEQPSAVLSFGGAIVDIGLLAKFFPSGTWHGSCTIILDADATVNITGPDSIVSGGMKVYAPRLVSGRIAADAVCLIPAEKSLAIVLQSKSRRSTGEETVQHTLIVCDVGHIVAIEFTDLKGLQALGLPEPVINPNNEYRPGSLVG